MEKISLEIRSVYLKILSFFILIMYPLRLIILFNDRNAYALRKHFFVPYKIFFFEEVPYVFISFFLISLLAIAMFFPKQIEVKKKIPFSKFFKLIFIIQNIGLIFTYTLFNAKWGQVLSKEASYMIILLESILAKEFIFFIVLYNEKIQKKSIGWVLFIYSFPFFLGGSKSGIIMALLYWISLKLALKEKIFNLKKVLILGIVYVSYPFIYYFSWMVRSGKLQKIPWEQIDIYSPLKLISHRVNGIDIFMGKYQNIKDISLLSTYENIMYFAKGIFGNGIIAIFTKNKKGYGRAFAEQVFYQPEDLINGYESTLIGTIYYSENRILLYCIIFLLIIGMIFFVKKISSLERQGFFMLFFLIQVILLVMMGLLLKLGLIIRFFLIYLVICLFLRSLKKERSIEKVSYY